jgi:hypothetical protein
MYQEEYGSFLSIFQLRIVFAKQCGQLKFIKLKKNPKNFRSPADAMVMKK